MYRFTVVQNAVPDFNTNVPAVCCMTEIQTPAGPLLLGAVKGFIALCLWSGNNRLIMETQKRLEKNIKGIVFRLTDTRQTDNTEFEKNQQILKSAQTQLRLYFKTELTDFTIPLLITGTAFQLNILEKILSVDYGKTAAYAEIGKKAGKESSQLRVRAAASAVSSNPLNIFIPCHRIIHSDGSPGNYGGGSERKKRLIIMEKEKIPYEKTC